MPRGARQLAGTVTGEFELHAQAVIVTSGGIGGNHDLVREQLAGAAGHAAASGCSPACPRTWTAGCSAITEAAGGRVINRDRMWHYAEGIHNWDPVWTDARHPHPARAVLAVAGRHRASRLPAPLFPGFDTLGTLEHIMATGSRPHLVRARRRRSSARSSRSPARSRTPT